MSLDIDLLADRRRMRRRLTLWRALAIVAVFGALALVAALRVPDALPGGQHVLRLPVSGFITEDRRVLQAIEDAAKNDAVRALVVAIDSPGGSMAGGEALHTALRRFAEHKPVVAVMGATAASAGYMAALPAQRIFAREATLTGSIGVKLMLPEFSGLMEKLGVGDNSIASGPLKDEPSLARKMSPAGREAMQAIVADMHEQFAAMVAAGRRMEPARVAELADGRAFTGRQALKLGLVDAIGGEREAREWLAEAKQVPATLPARELGRRGWAERALGEDRAEGVLPALLGAFVKTVLSQRLDGGWAIWQPDAIGR